jgi:hypothetical protein
MLGGRAALSLSTQITRDWRLSPDGTRVAFIESDLTNGLSYRARVMSLDGQGGATAQAMSAAGQQLGVAWLPGTGDVAFGHEPAAAAGDTGAASAQALTAAGFDIPVAYSEAGTAIVQAWSGPSFSDPGRAELTVVRDGQRTGLGYGTRFLGWSAR